MKSKEQILRGSLLLYWIILPLLFFGITAVYSLESKVAYQKLLTNIPGLALGLLVSCLSFIMAFLLYSFSGNESNLLRNFLFFALFQQLVSLNFIGVGLSYFYYKVTPKQKEKQSFSILLLLLIVFVGIFSLMSAILLGAHYL